MFDTMVDPTAQPGPGGAAATRAARPDELAGRTVGLLANTKKNAAAFLDAVGALLTERHGAEQVVVRTKTSITDPVPAATFEELRAGCDVVVIGVGDCGSCSASAVVDGISFELAGVPAAVVCSDAFRVSADAMARLRGAEGYPYAAIPHPLASLDADGVRARAAQALPEIVALLTAAGPAPGSAR